MISTRTCIDRYLTLHTLRESERRNETISTADNLLLHLRLDATQLTCYGRCTAC